jgi:hypothetical protein
MTMDLLSPALLPDFAAAGWFPGRDVGAPDGVPDDHPGSSVLRAFGGLRVGRTGRGEECGTSDVAFCHLISGDPLVADWERALATKLIGIGEIDNAHGELLMDSMGRLFTNSGIHPAFSFVGPSFTTGVERALRGRKVRPMLLPDTGSITLYGRTFYTGDPDVLTPELLTGPVTPRARR